MQPTHSQYWFLRQQALFESLDEEEIKQLCWISAYKQAKKGDIIYFSDQSIDRFYLLKKGRIKIAYYDESGSEIVSEILKEGDIFGELTLQPAENANHEFAQAISAEVSVCSFLIEPFKEILGKRPDVAIRFSKMVGDKLKIISARYADLVFKDARTRIVNFFRLHAQHEGRKVGDSYVISMFMTHQDIADFTGSSRQTVTTIINQLEAEGKLKFDGRKRLLIPDINQLR
jgi:CRP/FNR family transcriptional regulator